MKLRKHRLLIALAAIPATALVRPPAPKHTRSRASPPGRRRWSRRCSRAGTWGTRWTPSPTNPRITPELLAAVHDQGFNGIRLPVTWTDHQGGAPDHTIDPAYLDRVHEVVNMALDEGLYVLLNVHHDS